MNTLTVFVVLAATVLALCACFAELPRLRGTTLVGVWLWSLISTCVYCSWVLGVSLRFWQADSPGRLLAGVALFCPNMALLGAKRPQDRAWHFVVVSLWIVLSLPVVPAWLFYPGRQMQLSAIYGVFLWLLVLMEILNRLATRGWWVGLLWGTAQSLALGNLLPGGVAGLNGWSLPLSVFLLAAGRWGHWWIVKPTADNWDLNQRWRAFATRFGLLWALRVWAAVNAVCHRQGWPVRLGWRGFIDATGRAVVFDSSISGVEHAAGLDVRALRQVMVNLLQRFENPSSFS
jgi:hypothetical protein